MSANKLSKLSKFSNVFECKLNTLKSIYNCNMQNKFYLYKMEWNIKEIKYNNKIKRQIAKN